MQYISNQKANKKKKSLKETIKAIPYLLPGLITIFILTICPIIYTVVISFTDYTIFSGNNLKFVAFKNFADVLTGPFKEIFFPVFGWNLIFAIFSTLGTFFLGLIVAIAINNPNMKERGIYRALLIIPWALPATVAILSWQGLLNGSYGAINNLLVNLNLLKEPIPWLTDPYFARVAIIMVNIWMGFPYMMNICLGALGGIPKSYYEAAEVDGASKWLQFRKITLPTLANVSYPLLISSFAFNFNNFGSAFLITKGGPARLNTQFAGYTDILASVNYKLSTQFGRFEIASALSILIFLLLGTMSYFQMKYSGQFEEVE